MPPGMEKLIKNCNSNEEICKSIVNHVDLKEAIKESLSMPIDLLKAVFSKLALKIFDAITDAEIEKYTLKEDQFDANITDLSRREDISKFKKFEDLLNKHTTRRTFIIVIFINVVTLSVHIIFCLEVKTQLKFLVIVFHILTKMGRNITNLAMIQRRIICHLKWKIRQSEAMVYHSLHQPKWHLMSERL